MSYKFTTGSVRRGDVFYEDDRDGEPTYIDFGQDTITLRPSGSQILFADADAVGIGTIAPISKLDVAGKIAITAEVATPAQPADGEGYIYSKSDGKLYWRSYDLSETDLTATGGGGGGREDMAQAGGLNADKLSDALTVLEDKIKEELSNPQ